MEMDDQNTSVVLKKWLCEMDSCFPRKRVCFVSLEFAFTLSEQCSLE